MGSGNALSASRASVPAMSGLCQGVPGAVPVAGKIRVPAVWLRGGHRAATAASRYQVGVDDRRCTPLYWRLWAAHLMTTGTPGLSATQLQHRLGRRRYETAWTMPHKLRRPMVNPDRQPLGRVVEVDECYVGGRATKCVAARGLGKRRGGLVAVEVRGTRAGRVRMQVVGDATADTFAGFVASGVTAPACAPTAVRPTCGWPASTMTTSPANSMPIRCLLRTVSVPCPRSTFRQQPQDLAARHLSWGDRSAPAGLPQRGTLSASAAGRPPWPLPRRPSAAAATYSPRPTPKRAARDPSPSEVNRTSTRRQDIRNTSRVCGTL